MNITRLQSYSICNRELRFSLKWGTLCWPHWDRRSRNLKREKLKIRSFVIQNFRPSSMWSSWYWKKTWRVAARQVHAFCSPPRELSSKVICEWNCNWMDSSDVFSGTNIERRNWIKLARPEASCRYDDNVLRFFLWRSAAYSNTIVPQYRTTFPHIWS